MSFPRKVAVLPILLSSFACGPTVRGPADVAEVPEIRPAPQAREASGPGWGAVDRVAGVRMTAASGAWREYVPAAAGVTPVKVTVENRGERPVRIRYGDFALMSPAGERFSALSPFGLDPRGESLAAAAGPVTDPEFLYDDSFRLSPYASSVYPGLHVYGKPFDFETGYYRRYSFLREEVPGVTPEMIARALPEGVLEPGGRLEGFVYFEEVDPDLERVRFRADLVDPRDGTRFGEISIPFVVLGER